MEVWSHQLLEPWLSEIPKERRLSQIVLDPMCGHGNLASFLLDQCGKLYLNDISPEMLSYIDDNIRSRATVLPAGDAARLSLPEDSVDVIVVSGALHHVYKKLPETLSEFRRVLRPEGWLLFGEPSNEFLLTRLARNTVYYLSSSFDHENERAFRHDELRSILIDTGFSGVRLRAFGSLGYLLMGQVSVIPVLKNTKSLRLLDSLRKFDAWVERSRLNKTCFALTGSARKAKLSMQC
jgi:ubiquinone/menaquinone biosynthesis C-methylase UbiE